MRCSTPRLFPSRAPARDQGKCLLVCHWVCCTRISCSVLHALLIKPPQNCTRGYTALTRRIAPTRYVSDSLWIPLLLYLSADGNVARDRAGPRKLPSQPPCQTHS